MTFNSSKNRCNLVSRKRNANCPPMSLNNRQLEQVEYYKYLGLLFTTDLRLSHHIETICTRKLLGLLYRQFANNSNPQVMLKLYQSLVRPHLEYGGQVPTFDKRQECTGECSKLWFTHLLQKTDCKLPGITRHISITLIREPEAFPVVIIYFL